MTKGRNYTKAVLICRDPCALDKYLIVWHARVNARVIRSPSPQFKTEEKENDHFYVIGKINLIHVVVTADNKDIACVFNYVAVGIFNITFPGLFYVIRIPMSILLSGRY